MYTIGGEGAAETSGVVSLVILVPVQPLLVELDNNLTIIVLFNCDCEILQSYKFTV